MTVKEMRKARGMSQAELAKSVGVSRQAISMIENGIIQLQVNRAKEIAKILECDWQIFFAG